MVNEQFHKVCLKVSIKYSKHEQTTHQDPVKVLNARITAFKKSLIKLQVIAIWILGAHHSVTSRSQ